MKLIYRDSTFTEASTREINLENCTLYFEENEGEPQEMSLAEFLYSLMKRIRDLEGRK